MQRIQSVLVIIVLLAVAFAGMPGAPAHARHVDPVMLPGVSFGMAYKDVRRALRQAKGDDQADFTTAISNITLGLNFLDGATFFTTDTEVTLAKAYGYHPLFFYKGRLFGVKREIDSMQAFLKLDQEFPQGRYRFHRFPQGNHPQRIFLLETPQLYGFTNSNNDLYLYHEGMRQEIMSNVQGSFCWHTKLYSPNLRKFIPEYSQCVRHRQPPQQKLAQDLQRCRQYCADTPEMFSSPQCQNICEEAHRAVLSGSAER